MICLFICMYMHTFEIAFSVTHLCLVVLNTRDLPPHCKLMMSPAMTHHLDNRCVLLMIHKLQGGGGVWITGIQIHITLTLYFNPFTLKWAFISLSLSLSKGVLPVLFRYWWISPLDPGAALVKMSAAVNSLRKMMKWNVEWEWEMRRGGDNTNLLYWWATLFRVFSHEMKCKAQVRCEPF